MNGLATDDTERVTAAAARARVAHVITRLIVGGAQENTLASVIGHRRNGTFDADLVVGPTFGPEGTLIPDAERAGIRAISVPSLRREVNPVLDPIATWRLASVFRRGRYDIVHTHSSKAGIVGRVAAHLAGVPIVVHTVHGWGFHDRQPAIVRGAYVTLERRTARLADALVTVTPRDAEKGLALGIGRPEQYTTIRSGIDVARFQTPSRSRDAVRAELGIAPEQIVVGSVMRLSPQKAPLDFVAAIDAVCRNRPDVIGVIVGDGPLRARVEADLATRALGDRVRLLGLRHDVPDLLATFDVFVLSSRWEGLPRVLPQAMAAGLPIVATEVDGSGEAIVPGENGFLVPPAEPGALARHVLELVDDPASRARLGADGRARAAAFDVGVMVRDIETLYARLMAARSRERPGAGSRA